MQTSREEGLVCLRSAVPSPPRGISVRVLDSPPYGLFFSPLPISSGPMHSFTAQKQCTHASRVRASVRFHFCLHTQQDSVFEPRCGSNSIAPSTQNTTAGSIHIELHYCYLASVESQEPFGLSLQEFQQSVCVQMPISVPAA